MRVAVTRLVSPSTVEEVMVPVYVPVTGAYSAMVIGTADMAQVPPTIWMLPGAGVSGLLAMAAVIVAVPPPMGRETVRLLLASIDPVTAVGSGGVHGGGPTMPSGLGANNGVSVPEIEPSENWSAPTNPTTCGLTARVREAFQLPERGVDAGGV